MTEPRLDRTVTLAFQGDWGQANLTRVCGWLAQEIGDRSGPGSRFAIWNGHGGADAVHALLTGAVDVALMTPAAATAMINTGVGPLAVDGVHRLRALGTVAQRDRVVTCVDAALGASTMDELASRLPELRIATSPDDGVNLLGLAAHHQLRAVGVDPAALRAAGGELHYSERPFPAIEAFRDGVANVLIHEAIMTPPWQQVAAHREVRYLDATEPVVRAFAGWRWPTATIPAGYLPGLDHDLLAPDFSDFLVLCTEDLPDDVAALLAWCMVATRDAIEVQYHHLAPDRSPITYPLEPTGIASAPIPLHPAAAVAYAALRDEGLAADWLTLSTADGPMRVYRVRPPAVTDAAAVVVLQEAFGVNDHIQDVARRVAAQGYLALAPDLFHRSGHATLDYADRDTALALINDLGPDQIGVDTAAVLAYLRDEERIPADRTGVMGFCFGGRAAFTAATALPGLAGTVVFYGPGIATGPHAVLDRTAKVTGPILMFVGDADPTIPAKQIAAIRDAGERAGVDLRVRVFPGAGHAFHCDARPAMYAPDAAAWAWRDATAFLADTVGPRCRT